MIKFGWRECTLGEILALQRGYDITKAEQNDGTVPVVTSSGPTSWHDKFTSEGPGVIIGRKGTLGKAFYLNGPFWAHDTTLWVKDFKGNIPKYLYYMLLSMNLGKYDVGSSNPTLNRNHLHLLPVLMPGVQCQQRIADILSAYDDLIEINQRRVAILEEMARRLFDEWFVRFRYPGNEAEDFVETELGRAPSGWSLGIVADCSQFINRGIAPTYDDAATGIVVNQKCIRDQCLSLEQARRQSKIVPDEKFLRYGDLVINSTGIGTLGRVAQVLVTLAATTVDSHVTIVRAASNIDLQFFGLHILRLEPQFERQGVGSTGQTELSRKAIADTAMMIPPERLMVDFGRIVTPIRAQAELLRQQNTRLRAARDLLLPKLISGEIEVGRAEAAFAVAAE